MAKKVKKVIKKKSAKKKTIRKTKRVKRVSFVAPGYHSLTPYITVHDGKAAVEFYSKAFGAKEMPGRMSNAQGKITHTEMKIGDSMMMLADEFPEWGNVSPQTAGKTPVQFNLYVKDADAVMRRAAEAGGKMVKPVEIQFYGDRSGRLEDPFGYTWYIATHVEDISPKEMEKRAAALYGEQ